MSNVWRFRSGHSLCMRSPAALCGPDQDLSLARDAHASSVLMTPPHGTCAQRFRHPELGHRPQMLGPSMVSTPSQELRTGLPLSSTEGRKYLLQMVIGKSGLIVGPVDEFWRYFSQLQFHRPLYRAEIQFFLRLLRWSRKAHGVPYGHSC